MNGELLAILILAGVHLPAFAWFAWEIATSEPRGGSEDDDGEGGARPPESPRGAPVPPGGGLPLPDARPARVRLREPCRLAAAYPATRRGGHERERGPARRPVRSG